MYLVRLIVTLIFQEATKYLGIDINKAGKYLCNDLSPKAIEVSA
jgi:hypothetical protein